MSGLLHELKQRDRTLAADTSSQSYGRPSMGSVEDTREKHSQARGWCGAGPLDDLTDDPATGLACDLGVDLTDAEIR